MKQAAVILLALLVVSATQIEAQQLTCVPPYYALSCDRQLHGPNGSSIDFSSHGLAAANGVAMTTVPDYLTTGYAFVTHGTKIHIISYDQATNGLSSVYSSLDLAAETGLPVIQLHDVHGANPVALDGSEANPGQEIWQFPLYVNGLVMGSGISVGYYFVLDQEALLDPNHPGPKVLGAGPLCDGGECAVSVTKLLVDNPGIAAASETVHLAGLDRQAPGAYTYTQAFYRLTRGSAAAGPWTVSRVAVEGSMFTSSTYPHLGMDVNPYSSNPFGHYPMSHTEIDLDDLTQSCDLGLTPVDISIWAVDPVLYGNSPWDYRNYHFIAARDGSGAGFLIGSPEGVCPDPALDHSVVEPLSGANPTETAILQWGHREFLIYTATASGVETRAMKILPLESGDKIEVGSVLTDPLGCIVDLTLLPLNLDECPCEPTSYCAEDLGYVPPPPGPPFLDPPCKLKVTGNVDCPGNGPSDEGGEECAQPGDPGCPDEEPEPPRCTITACPMGPS